MSAIDNKGGEESDPVDLSAIKAFLRYKPAGTAERPEIPLAPEALAAYRLHEQIKAERAQDDAAAKHDQRVKDGEGTDAERLIGPRNPDHPLVNRDGGGRSPTKS